MHGVVDPLPHSSAFPPHWPCAHKAIVLQALLLRSWSSKSTEHALTRRILCALFPALWHAAPLILLACGSSTSLGSLAKHMNLDGLRLMLDSQSTGKSRKSESRRWQEAGELT